MEITEVDETHCEGRQPSCEDVTATARHDLPLCPNRMITALEAVRGTGSALELLREHLHLRTSAKIVYSDHAECYFLQLDDIDRFKNRRVGMHDAVSAMPFRSGEIFRREISTWTPFGNLSRNRATPSERTD